MAEIIDLKDKNTKIAEAFGEKYKAAEIAVIRDQVCKGANDMELMYFLNVCKSVDLNPFNKEIWAYKDTKGNLLTFAGRDGFLAKAQQNSLFGGMRSSEVCENDDISIDIPNGVVNHKINPKSPRGAIIGSYAIVFRKGGECTVEWSDFASYNKGYNVWKSDPASMIKKVSESHALKKAFGISGIQSEFDFDIENNIAKPRNKFDDYEEVKEPKDHNLERCIKQLEQCNDIATLNKIEEEYGDCVPIDIFNKKRDEIANGLQ